MRRFWLIMLQKISYNLGIATLSRVVLGGISLVVVGILTRYLGPDGFGQYSAIFAYLYIFAALADVGLYTVMVREISKDGANESTIASKIFTLRFFIVIGFVAVANILVFVFPYPAQVKTGILIASLFSVLSSLAQVLTGIFQKHLRVYLISLSDVLARLIQVGALLLLVRFETGLLWFVGVVVFTEAVHFGLIYSFAKSLTPIKFNIDWRYWKEILKTALPIAVSLVLVLIYFKLDTVMLSIMKPAKDVGIYSVAYKVLEAVIFLPAIYIGLVMPILSKHAFADRLEFIKVFRRAFDVISIFALWFSAYLFIMSDWVVRIIGGGGFAEAGPVLKILSVAIFLIFFGNLGGNAIIALNLQKKAMWIYFTGAVVNIGGNLLLIPRYSYFAAASTTVATELLITLLMFGLIKKSASATVNGGVFGKALLAAIATSLLILPLRGNFALASLVWLGYFPILFLFGGFTKADIRGMISLKKTPELPGEVES